MEIKPPLNVLALQILIEVKLDMMCKDVRHRSFFCAILILLLVLPSHVFTSAKNVRSLESTADQSSASNIEVYIKAENADYHSLNFDDSYIYYCEKMMGPLGVNDICALRQPQFNMLKSLLVSNVSSLVYLNGDHMLEFKRNSLTISGLQTVFDRPRTQLLSATTLSPEGGPDIDHVYFSAPNQQAIIQKGKSITFYKLKELEMIQELEIENPSSKPIDFEATKIFYFQDKFVIFFDRKNSELEIFTIESNKKLKSHSKKLDCQEVIVDSKFIYVFTKDKIKAIDEKDELEVDFQYTVRFAVQGSSSGVFVYIEGQKDSQENARVFNVEVFGNRGFRLTPVLVCPASAKSMYISNTNLYLIHENWLRVYPNVKEKQYSDDFFFDYVFSKEVIGILSLKDQEYLTVRDNENEISLYNTGKSSFGLECKKEKGSFVTEYIFQVRCLSTKCENPDFTTQKFANGTCAYTRNIMLYSEEEGGALGVILLIGLGFVAGIAITMGLGVFNCFSKKSEEEVVKTHSPKEKKSFNINRGLRRQSPINNGGETRKFLHENNDETYPSEELRENVAALNNIKKKGAQVNFETPRFTSFGSNLHSVQNHAPHVEYAHISSAEREAKTSGEDEVHEVKPQMKIEPLKISENRQVFKDPHSFRDIATNMQASPEKEGKHSKLEGKYGELQDEIEDSDGASTEQQHGGSFTN